MKKKIPTVREITIVARNIQSLVWEDNTLVDWAAGGIRYGLDGSITPRAVYYPFAFDAAVSLANGKCAVIYQKFGTKGLLLRHGEIVREINRSYYFAGSFEYPVAVGKGLNRRVLLAHCPDAYNRLEIEDFMTGERLSASLKRKPSDFFHSRLSFSGNGQYVMSAGWCWHPVDDVRLFDVGKAVADPRQLDSDGLLPACYADESCAAFDLTGNAYVSVYGDINEEAALNEVRIFSPGSVKAVNIYPMAERLGTIYPLGSHQVLSLYAHPKLIDLATCQTLMSWPHINSGSQVSSIQVRTAPVSVMAFDKRGRKLAVAGPDSISVLLFDA